MLSAPDALLLAQGIVGAGVVVSAVEDLVGRAIFRDDGLLSWQVTSSEAAWSATGLSGRLIDAVLRWPVFRLVLVLRLVGGLALLVASAAEVLHPLAIAAALLPTIAISLRTMYGIDGAHQMSLLVLVALLFASLDPHGATPAIAAGFVAIQAILSYAIAGIAKLFGSAWRDGSGLPLVMSTSSYGHPAAGRILVAHPGLALAASWWIIVFESSALLVLAAPDAAVLVWLGLAAGFHVANAFVMGLNSFLWAWLATYPCVLFLAGAI